MYQASPLRAFFGRDEPKAEALRRLRHDNTALLVDGRLGLPMSSVVGSVPENSVVEFGLPVWLIQQIDWLGQKGEPGKAVQTAIDVVEAIEPGVRVDEARLVLTLARCTRAMELMGHSIRPDQPYYAGLCIALQSIVTATSALKRGDPAEHLREFWRAGRCSAYAERKIGTIDHPIEGEAATLQWIASKLLWGCIAAFEGGDFGQRDAALSISEAYTLINISPKDRREATLNGTLLGDHIEWERKQLLKAVANLTN